MNYDSLYIRLLKRTLLGLTFADGSVTPKTIGKRAEFREHDSVTRAMGADWPALALSMIGVDRMDNLHECIETVLDDEVQGDFLEAGVWRGGASIFMRGLLKAYGVENRTVWVADSFQGMPVPNPKRYPLDKNLHLDRYAELSVSLDNVKRNFERFELLDEHVEFLEGWFSDTLPFAPVDKLAILRLDGDLYESTMDGLVNMYPRLEHGGFVIVDDGAILACRQAVMDYRSANSINEEIEQIDWTGLFWRKM